MEMLEDCNGEAGTLEAEIANPSNANIQINQCKKRFFIQPLLLILINRLYSIQIQRKTDISDLF